MGNTASRQILDWIAAESRNGSELGPILEDPKVVKLLLCSNSTDVLLVSSVMPRQR